MRRTWVLLVITLVVGSGRAQGASAISRHVLACGGCGGSGATHEIRSTLGQPVVGTATSAHHTVNAGFWLGYQLTPSSVEGHAIQGPLATVAVPARFHLYPSAPNPTGRGSQVAYDVPAGGGPVLICLYAADGALVRTLVNGPQAPGRHLAVWDGRNDRGRMTASGVYFLTMAAPEYKGRQSLIVIR